MKFINARTLSRTIKDIGISLAVGLMICMPVSSLFQATSAADQPDCDNNAVIHCGAFTTAEVKSNYDNNPSVQTIYHYFGIDHNEINNLHTTAVSGTVTAGGRVLDQNGKEVATNAITAGRQDIQPGSTKHVENGVTFYTRAPSVSFKSPSLDAFVVIKDGVFQFAIIKACGNPVKATPNTPPPPTPTTPTPIWTTPHITLPPAGRPSMDLTCDRIWGDSPALVGKYFQLIFDANNNNVAEGQEILAQGGPIDSTGYSTGVRYGIGAGTPTLNGAAVFGNGTSSKHFILLSSSGERWDYTAPPLNCVPPTPMCKYNPAIPADSAQCVPPQQPVFSCDKLTSLALSRTNYSFAITASASNGATVEGYSFDFGDGSSSVSTDKNTPTTSHVYAAPGTYNVTGTASVNVPSTGLQAVTSANCKTTVTVAPAPAAECTSLTLQSAENRTVKVTDFQTTASNGAVFRDAVIDWGDGTAKVTTASVIGQTHQYAADGNYTVSVLASFTTNGQPGTDVQTDAQVVTDGRGIDDAQVITDTGPACQQPVTFAVTPPTPPTTPPTTTLTSGPTTLVNTGPGSVAGVFGAVTVFAALAHRRRLSNSL